MIGHYHTVVMAVSSFRFMADPLWDVIQILLKSTPFSNKGWKGTGIEIFEKLKDCFGGLAGYCFPWYSQPPSNLIFES